MRTEESKRAESAADLDRLITQAEKRLTHLDRERAQVFNYLSALRQQRGAATPAAAASSPRRDSCSSGDELVSVMRRPFRGREDVYARRWESATTGGGARRNRRSADLAILLAICEIRGQPVNDRPAAGRAVRTHQEAVPVVPHHHVVSHLEWLALVQVEELFMQRGSWFSISCSWSPGAMYSSTIPPRTSSGRVGNGSFLL